MSDSKDKPKMPPPDDFSKTTPNIDIDPEDSAGSKGDWDDSGYGSAPDAPADDWGKTVINYNVSSLDESDDDDDDEDEKSFGAELHPSKEKASEPDWGMTQQNFNVNDEFGSGSSEADNDSVAGATVPYFKLPDAEKAKYQNIPPTPTERAEKEAENKKKEGGVPMWFWVAAGLMMMFSFAVLVLLGVWFFFTGPSSFTVRVKGAQPFSQFFVDGGRWGVTNAEKTVDLVGLRPGKRKIIIRKKGYTDDEQEVTGESGDVLEIFARQQQSEAERQGCEQIIDVKTREDCANLILDNLDSPPNLDDLLRALNLYYINFDSGADTIPPARQKFLERASTYLKQLPETVVIEIGGHTDNVGSDSNNQALSERRANSVKEFFVANGIKPGMLMTRGYGETNPKDSNETESGRFQNRRIQYTAVKR